ncbi:hypothetical protein C8R45DRAFT_1099271 [Mycena sanguinolenta]|nr:hypothetical protein C8R45DRAFT_1099271 [Mycena sanguinolenta]
MSVAGAVPSPISTAIDTPATSSDTLIPHQVCPSPALKRRKFAVPQEERHRAAAILAIAAGANILASSLTAINKLIASKKDVFHAGNASLQLYRARSIESHLHMVVKDQKGWKLASETAAEAQGFATKWGGVSKIGKHGKSYSLYNDPIIHAELRSYIRSEKWAMDPAKLVESSEQKMVPAAADKYLRKITEEEMPAGVKKYMEVELFPRMAFKVGRGISLRMARRLLQQGGALHTQNIRRASITTATSAQTLLTIAKIASCLQWRDTMFDWNTKSVMLTPSSTRCSMGSDWFCVLMTR